MSAPAASYNRLNPFSATITETILLSGALRNKRTRHIELSLEDAGLSYRPGDSLGVWPENPPELAERILEQLHLGRDEVVSINGEEASAYEWLVKRLEITRISVATLRGYLNHCEESAVAKHVGDDMKAFVDKKTLLDLIQIIPPAAGDGAAVLACLRHLSPRLYSLASSPNATPEEAHLLVSVSYHADAQGIRQAGLCSGYLDSLAAGETVRVYVHSSPSFHLPPDDSATVLIGPGTGIAPFRAFLQEREEAGNGGKNWLFFGEWYRDELFYYQTEWQQLLETGVLSDIDVAFSRDQQEKIYVQHRLYEKRHRLMDYISEGAYLYICGDEARMAKDVEATLLRIFAEHTGSREGALDFLEKLRENGRYLRDVY